MFNKKFIVLTIIMVGLIALSAVSANDNATDEMTGDVLNLEEETAISQDENAGSFIELNRLVQNTSQGNTLKLNKDYRNNENFGIISIDKEMTIDGQGHIVDANEASRVFYIDSGGVTLRNITFVNGFVEDSGGIVYFEENAGSQIVDCSFINCSAQYGGALYFSTATTSQISNSTFINCSAQFGGAIYYSTDSQSQISDCTFECNSAEVLGGCILGGNNVLSIRKSTFTRSGARYESGGAITLLGCSFNAEYIEVTQCSSEFGGAVTLLNSNSNITHSTFTANNAAYDGGAIFAMYNHLNLDSNKFFDNSAKRGGAVYSSMTNTELLNNRFTGNCAVSAGAFYAMSNIFRQVGGNIYENNNGNPEDLYQCVNDNLTFFSDDYYQFKYSDVDIGPLPNYYSMVEENLLTPVKDQGTEGNCWSFAAMAALESCILKASGVSWDLSEANMKNLMVMFSDYGHMVAVNSGGHDTMTFGYMASWLGPIFELEDNYYINDFLSPLLKSQMHIQNILLIKRSSFTDNDAIKYAILKYGAVVTGMNYNSSYRNDVSYYYDGDENSTNHAVCIVGWNDSYSRYNFNNTPPADGAWIVRNSWGPSWGDGGYFYVSYYDKLFAEVNERNSYTFILNDTVKLNRIYQYEIEHTDNHLIFSNATSFKNIFTVQGDEYLAAVSTYFNQECRYNVTIYINGEYKSTKSGKTTFLGYYTIYLDNMLYLNKNDNVTVQFTLYDYDDEKGSVAVSSIGYTTNLFLKEGRSYFWDNVKWVDYYTSNDCVACIKMFTTIPGEDKLVPYIEVQSEFDSIDGSCAIYINMPNDATGMVIIKNADGEYQINISETRSTVIYNLNDNNNQLLINYTGDDRYYGKLIPHTVDTEVKIGTLEEFENEIDSLRENQTFTLKKDYLFNDYLIIWKSIIIDGHGHTISGGNTTRLFLVYDNDVVIRNLKLVDTYDNAIWVYYPNCTIINCSFINNNGNTTDGAIYWQGDSGKVLNCSFKDCFALQHGGAIYWECDDGLIENSVFADNTAGMYGGAIYWSGKSGHVINSSFINNTVGQYAGAILWAGENGQIDSSVFVNNSALTYSGGAIYVNAEGIAFNGCNFTNNYANRSGGAVYLNEGGSNVDNCLFIQNKASAFGGAVYSTDNGILSNSTFIRNHAESYGGAVLWQSEYGYFVDLTFEDNVGDYVGGIYCYGAHASLVNSTFINTLGIRQIYWVSETGTIEGCRFLKTTKNNFQGSDGILVKRNLDLRYNNTSFEYGNPKNVSVYSDYLKDTPVLTPITIELSKNGFKKFFSLNFVDGIAVIDDKLFDLDIGIWSGQVVFVGDDNYNGLDTTVTLKINQAVSRVNLTAANVTVGHETQLTARVSDADGHPVREGKVTFFDGSARIGVVDVVNGVATLPYSPSAGGEHMIRAEFEAIHYMTSDDSFKLFVDSVCITIIAEGGTVGYETTLTANVKGLYSIIDEGSILFYGGTTYIGKSAVVNGVANLTFIPLNALKTTIKAVFTGSSKFKDTENSTEYEVARAESQITLNPISTGTVGDVFRLRASVSSPNQLTIDDGYVTFYDNGVSIGSANVLNGQASFDYIVPKAGSRTISATFYSNDYLSNTSKFETEISRTTTTISIDDIGNAYANAQCTITATVLSNGRAVGEGTVKFIIGNQEFPFEVVNGHASVVCIFTATGTYKISAEYVENNDYLSSNCSKTFNVLKQPTVITSGDISIVYNSGGYLTATLKGVDGKPLSGMTLSVDLNGPVTLTTDSNGQIRLFVNNLVPNSYDVSITFAGNDKYVKSSASVKVNVLKGSLKIVASKKTFRSKVKIKKYVVSLKDTSGKAIGKVKLTLKVKSKTFKVTTNAKGKATFKIKKLTKKGKYTATVTFKGNNLYNKATKKVKIIVK